MGQVSTFNENVFHSIWSGMHDTLVAALSQVSKNVLFLYDLYEIWTK